MAEAKTSTTPAAAAEQGKTVVVVGVDDSEHSYHALEWTVRHVAAASIISFGGAGGFLGKKSPHLLLFLSLDRRH
jgi:hypothetical protein